MEREASIVGFGESLKRRSPGRRTATDYVSDVRQFAQTCDKPWQEVTMLDIDQFVDQQRQAGRSPATVRRRCSCTARRPIGKVVWAGCDTGMPPSKGWWAYGNTSPEKAEVVLTIQ